MDPLPCSVSLTFDDGQGGGQGGCLVWFWLLILRPDALPITNNTLLVPGPRRYSLRRSIVMPDRRAYIYHHHHHHHRLASVFPCLHGSDVAPKIFLLHNSPSLASSTPNPNRFISLLTHSLHVLLPPPPPTLPSTPRPKHLLTQSSFDFLSPCPYHLSLP